MSSFSTRIFHLADAVNQPLRHKLFVEHRQLHSDARQVLEARCRFAGVVLAILVIEIHQDVAVHAVRRQQDQYEEIRNEQGDVETVRVIEALKRAVEKVLANVRANALGGNDGGKPQIRNEQTSQARCSPRTICVRFLNLSFYPKQG